MCLCPEGGSNLTQPSLCDHIAPQTIESTTCSTIIFFRVLLLLHLASGSPLNGKDDGFACGCSGGDPSGVMRWTQANGIEAWASAPYTNNTAACDGMYDLSPANCNCGDGGGSPACPAHPKCPDQCSPHSRRPVVTVDGYVQVSLHASHFD